MSVAQDRIPHARVVTPTVTFVKHEFRLAAGEASVRRGPDIKRQMVLTEEAGVYEPGVYRLVGLVDGQSEIWRVDNQGCGFGVAVKELPTDPNEIPT
jgi:hypothetical protein